MINATDIRKGMIVKIDNEPYIVLDYTHVAPGNWRAMVQVKLRHLKQGSRKEQRLSADDRLEQIFVEVVPMEYLYPEKDYFVFMNLSTYDQINLNKDIVGDAVNYLKSNTEVNVNYYEGTPITIQLPINVDLLVTQTDPSLKGATVTNVYKSATLETGIVIQVPPFVEQGEMIRVDTREGKYVERVK
jgi:elongation factor P